MADFSPPSSLTLRSRASARPSSSSAPPPPPPPLAPSTTPPKQPPDDPLQPPRPSQTRPSKEEDLNPAPACLGLAIAVVFVVIVLYFASEPVLRPRLWTKEELASYNGTDEELPIMLSIMGSVFDVTRGRTHYGVGGGYNHFAGRDATRAFVSGNFVGDGLTDSVTGLSAMEMKSLVDWRSFYHKSYIYTGKLVGTFFDSNGNATKELRQVEAKAKLGVKLLKQQEAEEKKHPNCNSHWSQNDGGEVWCDSGYPRLVHKVGELPLTGKTSSRCACFKREELSKAGLQVYESCDPFASACRL